MNKTILIIEDEMINGLYLKSVLENSGYNVMDIATNGQMAISSAITARPDLIISDVQLAGDISGLDIINHLKKHIDTPFIFLTAYNDTVTIDKIKSSEPYRIILKPYDIKELLTSIKCCFNSPA